MLPLLLVHLFTRFMPKTVGQTIDAGWAESRPGAQMGWTWDVLRGIRGESFFDLCDCFFSSLEHPRTQHICLATMCRRSTRETMLSMRHLVLSKVKLCCLLLLLLLLLVRCAASLHFLGVVLRFTSFENTFLIV